MHSIKEQATTTVFSQRRSNLYWILSALFVTNALLAEILGSKIFSLEATLGLSPAQLPMGFGYVLDFNLTAGVIIWPVVFIGTDLINEYFGSKGVWRVSWLTCLLIGYAFLIISILTLLQPAPFWLNLNNTDTNGQPFDINFAYNTVLKQGLGIIVGSLTAFLVGQVLDAWVFQRLRKLTSNRFLWLRATGSTLISQLIDSILVLFIAFYLLGNWPLDQVMAVAGINYIYKLVIAIVLTPLLYPAHALIDRYLGTER